MSIEISLFLDEHKHLDIDVWVACLSRSLSCIHKYAQLKQVNFCSSFPSLCHNSSVVTFILFGLVVRQPWNWEALIFHTLFRVIEVILIFLGIRMIGAGSLLLEVTSSNVTSILNFSDHLNFAVEILCLSSWIGQRSSSPSLHQ
jgi:hypothetical protein